MAATLLGLLWPGAAGTASASSGGPRWRTLGGDAWDWKEAVQGVARCRSVRIEDDGKTLHVPVTRRGSRFSATVWLHPGPNRLMAGCGGARSRPLVFTERRRPDPKALIRVTAHGAKVTLDGTGSRPRGFDRSPIVSYRWSAGPGNPARVRIARPGARTVSIRAPRADGEYHFTLEIRDRRGRVDRSTTYFVVKAHRAHPVDMATAKPSWINRAVVYGVIPQLFGDHGFRSVDRKLPYLNHLGVTALWLSPFNGTTPGDFGYNVTNYFRVRGDYGTKADLHKLIDDAHRLGLRVLMDFVANHLSTHSAYYRDTKRHGRRSHYWSYFDRKPSGATTHYFDWTNLPNLNYANPEVRHLIIAACSYWVRDFHFDGFRMDAAWGVHRRARRFWVHWRLALKRIDPDLLLIAEAPAYDPYYFTHGFDVAYDWRGIGQWSWQSVFNSPTLIPHFLKDALNFEGRGTPKGGWVFRFLDNNDTGTRFAATYGADTARVAAALEFTVPGLPLVYGGDEIAANYDPYFDLHPLEWNQDPDHFRPYYERLIRLRDRLAALRSHRWTMLSARPSDRAFAYLRFRRGARPVLVVLNFGAKAMARVGPPAALGAFRRARSLTDVLHDETVNVSHRSLTVPMPAFSARILVGAR